jgi:multidrug efflux pump subunit AcrA (membrane-fusion protein)
MTQSHDLVSRRAPQSSDEVALAGLAHPGRTIARDFPRLDIRAPLIAGALMVFVFVAAAVAAAFLAPIQRGAAFQGVIIAETRVKTLQHDRGGRVGRVHVSEGAEVAAGALLVTLDTATLLEQQTALRAQMGAARQQLGLIRQESQTMTDLAERQLAARSRASALSRQVAEVEKEIASLEARLAMIGQDLERSEIRAPVAGRILSLAVTGTGAVIAPAQTIVELVPKDDRLVIEGRLSPHQVDVLKAGMPARVWLTSLSWREHKPLAARLAWVSADALEDKRSGAIYFTARVELDPGPDPHHPRLTLQPGMRAEILVVTGERSLVDQLIDPIFRNINRAFRA